MIVLEAEGSAGAELARPVSEPARDFDEFYARHFGPLTLQLHAYAGDLTEAQDLVQEAFCRALARWGQVSRYDEPVAWVRRVAWNLATSRWRQKRRASAFLRKQREQHIEAPSPDRVLVVRALRTLPLAHRRAVVLHYIGGLSVAEIAAQEGAAEGTVKSWLYRGRAALAAALAVGDKENGSA